ncbi:MAG: hypothetical protein LUG88_04735 [Clostridia bacterium]|nr:hypothetical protein [Clostridia bacterium]
MTNEQKMIISSLRAEGMGYSSIARKVGISENTVKSFCRRNASSWSQFIKKLLNTNACAAVFPSGRTQDAKKRGSAQIMKLKKHPKKAGRRPAFLLDKINRSLFRTFTAARFCRQRRQSAYTV